MKYLIALIACASVFAFAGFVSAKGDYSGKRGGGGGNNIQGTVASVGSGGFAVSVGGGRAKGEGGGKAEGGGRTVNVVVNSNTRYILDGKPAPNGSIKEGVHVTVEGGITGKDQITAQVVTIMGAGGEGERKKKKE